MQRFSLGNRRALVTGSTQGIGFALAGGLAEAGASVIVNGRNEARVATAVESLRARGFEAEGAAFDVTEAGAVNAAVARLLRDGRPIDILVNNAGIQIRAPLLEISQENWQKVIDTNLTSAFLVARAVVPGMIARKAGKIVNICSLGSELARATTGPYTAAKGGLRMLTRMMCVEWARENIQVNGLGPGYIATEMTEPLVRDPKFDSWVRGRTPAGRWGTPDDLVGTCVFLSSAAADFVNGQLIYVDGGWTSAS